MFSLVLLTEQNKKCVCVKTDALRNVLLKTELLYNGNQKNILKLQSGENMKRIIDGEKTNITGKRIKAARINAGLSQQQLSDKLELSAVYVCRGSVSRIENGERAVTDIEIDAISKVLGATLDYLFGRSEE